MALLFWASIVLIAYVYVGYPAILHVESWMADRGRRSSHEPSAISHQPSGVSIVIAARNEASRLAARLDNLLALDWPAAQRQIIVVSDGSTDNTLDVLAPYRRDVDVIALPPGGKALAINAGVAQARFDIVAFADARQVFAPDALREL